MLDDSYLLFLFLYFILSTSMGKVSVDSGTGREDWVGAVRRGEIVVLDHGEGR